MRNKFARVFLSVVLLGLPAGTWAHGLTILFTNDVHGHLGPGKNGGFARLCTLVKRERKNAAQKGDDSIFVIAGDAFQGTLISSISRGAAEFAAMKACGVDAFVVGNHDFDYGLKDILGLAGRASFPVLCANCRYRHSRRLVFKPYTTIQRGKHKLLLLGLITTKTPLMTSGQKSMKRLIFPNPAGVLKTYARKPYLIVLSHLGFPADRKLAMTTHAQTVIIGGHTHTVLKKCVVTNHIPICQAGAYARYLGVMHVDYDKGGLKYVDSKLIPVTQDIPADPGVMKAIEPWMQKVKKEAQKRIGIAARDFPANGRALHSRETVLGDLVCDAMLEQSGADAGFVNAGGIRWSLNKGVVTFRDIYRVLPFNNHVFILKIKGKALKRLLYHIIKQRGKNGFMQICGMTVDIRHHRILKLSVHGAPWYRDRTYKVATIGFLVKGGDGYGFLQRYQPKDTGILLRNTLIDFIRKHSPIGYPPQGRWNFDTGL